MTVKEMMSWLELLPAETKVYRKEYRDCADPEVESMSVEFKNGEAKVLID